MPLHFTIYMIYRSFFILRYGILEIQSSKILWIIISWNQIIDLNCFQCALVKKMLSEKPEERPSAKEILQHSMFKKFEEVQQIWSSAREQSTSRIQSHLTPHRHSSGSGSSSWLATSPHCMWVGHSKPWKHSELRLWWIICGRECSEMDQLLHGVGELRCEPSISNFNVLDKLWLLIYAE